MRHYIISFCISLVFASPASAQETSGACDSILKQSPENHFSAIQDIRTCYRDTEEILGKGESQTARQYIEGVNGNIGAQVNDLKNDLCAKNDPALCEFGLVLEKRTNSLLSKENQHSYSDYVVDSGYGSALVIGKGQFVEPLYLCSDFFLGKGLKQNQSCRPLNSDWEEILCDANCKSKRDAVLQAIPRIVDMSIIAARPELGQEFAGKADFNSSAWNNYILGDEKHSGLTIWEVALNDMFIPPKGSDARFTTPDTKQLIALRPSLGFKAYESNGSNVEIAGLVELVGIRWWDEWAEGGERVGSKGFSIVTAYSPSDVSNDIGFGVLVDNLYKDIDVSVIARDGDDGTDVSVLFSVDVSKVLPKVGLKQGCEILGLGSC